MAISRDRVRFKVGDGLTDKVERAAFQKAFGVDMPFSPRQVICRPSQFARFLIYRNDEGGKNAFKALDPKLVSSPLDPHDYRAMKFYHEAEDIRFQLRPGVNCPRLGEIYYHVFRERFIPKEASITCSAERFGLIIAALHMQGAEIDIFQVQYVQPEEQPLDVSTNPAETER